MAGFVPPPPPQYMNVNSQDQTDHRVLGYYPPASSLPQPLANSCGLMAHTVPQTVDELSRVSPMRGGVSEDVKRIRSPPSTQRHVQNFKIFPHQLSALSPWHNQGDRDETSHRSLTEGSISLNSSRKGQDLSELRTEAKRFITLMYEHKYGYKELLKEGLDPALLKGIYDELHIPVTNSATVDMTATGGGGDLSAVEQTNGTKTTNSASPSMEVDAAATRSEPSAQLSLNTPKNKTSEVAEKPMSPNGIPLQPDTGRSTVTSKPSPSISVPNARDPASKRTDTGKTVEPIFDRKDHIARLMAAKKGKTVPTFVASTSESTEGPAGSKEMSKSEPTSVKLGKPSIVSGEDDAAAAKQRATTELARKKLEALQAAKKARSVHGKRSNLDGTKGNQMATYPVDPVHVGDKDISSSGSRLENTDERPLATQSVGQTNRPQVEPKSPTVPTPSGSGASLSVVLAPSSSGRNSSAAASSTSLMASQSSKLGGFIASDREAVSSSSEQLSHSSYIVDRSFTGIPGLFMTASASRPAVTEPPAVTLSPTPVTQSALATQQPQSASEDVAAAPRALPNKSTKRPVASDFDDAQASQPNKSFKRPFGHKRHEDVDEEMIIEVSDDETAESVQDSALEDEDSQQLISQEVAVRKPKSTDTQAAVRDLPPLKDFPPRFKVGGTNQSDSNSSTPLAAQTPATVKEVYNLRDMEQAVLDMKRKIAEAEKRRRAKAEVSRAQTPSTPNLGVRQITSSSSSLAKALDKSAKAVTTSQNPNDKEQRPSSIQFSQKGDIHEATRTDNGVLDTTSDTVEVEVQGVIGHSSHAVPSTLDSDGEAWKKRRRAELESGLSASDVTVASQKAKLEQLKKEMEELESEMQQRLRDKETLARELESLGIDTEGMPHAELQAKREEILQRQDEQAAARLESSGPGTLRTPHPTNEEIPISLVSDKKTTEPVATQNLDTGQKQSDRNLIETRQHNGHHQPQSNNSDEEASASSAMSIDESTSSDEGEISELNEGVPDESTKSDPQLPTTLGNSQASACVTSSASLRSLDDDMEKVYASDRAYLVPVQGPASDHSIRVPQELSVSGCPDSDMRWLRINGLPYATVEEDLRNYLIDLPFEVINLPKNINSSRSLGFAYVRFPSVSVARDAVVALDNRSILGRRHLSIQLARRTEDPPATGSSPITVLSDTPNEVDEKQAASHLSQSAARESETSSASSDTSEEYEPADASVPETAEPEFVESSDEEYEPPEPTPSTKVPSPTRDPLSPDIVHSELPNNDVVMNVTADDPVPELQPASEPQQLVTSLSMGTTNPGRTNEEKQQWTEGLKSVIKELRERNTKDPDVVAQKIAEYRRNFLKDPTKILNL
ncbi:hypothetical protein LTR16_001161 [Cryomyces antarcticus]|uniref:RRM domain-containing protein n=1 Tax=Cryomyces antarcticus TaxID=329879 RepID=A0ABR0M8C1_9PEZI|nr:hypothetical protein LTR16_001161 [Cryomyces antarcticus]